MSNFLDLRCPCCRDPDHIDILAMIWVRLTEDGTDADESDDGDHEWSGQSAAVCTACGHRATVQAFEPALEVQS
jgi:hypothetical protein